MECLCRIRYKKLHTLILRYPYKTSRAIAHELGLQDEQAMYKFLNRHYNTNFTEVRNKLMEKRRREARDRKRSEEHTSELQSRFDLVCRLLLEKKNTTH